MDTQRSLIAIAGVLFCAAFAPALAVHAQFTGDGASVRVAVFRTATADPALQKLGEALDPVVLDELGQHEALVQVTARPPLDMPATQLALDCVGETAACLREATTQAGVDVLIAPSIERAGGETVVTLLYFDGRGAGELRNATRRHSGANVERAALDAVPAMVRELLGLAEPTEPPPSAATTDATLADVEIESPAMDERPFPVAPLVIGVAGLAIVGAGLAFGLAAKANEDDYAGLPLDTREQIDIAEKRFETADTQALIANIGLGFGAAVTLFGAVWLGLELAKDGDEGAARLTPEIAPGHVGLALSGSFVGEP